MFDNRLLPIIILLIQQHDTKELCFQTIEEWMCSHYNVRPVCIMVRIDKGSQVHFQRSVFLLSTHHNIKDGLVGYKLETLIFYI